MSQRHRRNNKRGSTELHTHVLADGMAALVLKTPPPIKRRRVDAQRGQVDLLQSKDFPEHVLVPPPPIHMTGRLKLAIKKTDTHFLVHVVRAKGLPDNQELRFATYVTVEITSAKFRRMKSMSAPISDVRNPHFQETFSIDIDDVAYKDRILISLYRHHDVRNDNLGCMSFGVKHLLQETKDIDGWYYLLNEELGVKKHLAAPSREKKCQSSATKEKKPIRVIKKVITITQRKQGYGFTILDTSPVRVGKVDSGGQAEQAGLEMGDVLIRINKYHVAKSSCSEIIGIVKNAPGHLRVVIERRVKRTTSETASDEGERRPLSSVSANCNYTRPQPMSRHWASKCSSTCSSDAGMCSTDDMDVQQVFGSMEEARQAAVRQLIAYQASFVRSMQYGLQEHLKPLRYHLCASQEFSRLSGAIEQMIIICSLHVQQLELRLAANSSPAMKSHHSKLAITTVGDAYLGKLDELLPVYASYQSCVRAVEEEVEVRMREQGMWSGDQYLIVRGFLHKPSECLNKLCQLLQMVWTSTPTNHPDHENLKHILNTLQSVHWWSETVKDGNTKSFNSTHLRQLQEKLMFGKNVKHFRLAESGRQFVFAGTLYKVNQLNPDKVKKLWAILCNDLLLLTRRREDDTLVVLEKLPVNLICLHSSPRNEEEELDFQITVVTSTSTKQKETKTLRAPTAQLKSTWKKLLKKHSPGMYLAMADSSVKDLHVSGKKELPRKRFEGISRPLLGIRRKISSPELQQGKKNESTLALLNRKVSSPEIKISTVDDDNNETKLDANSPISEEKPDDDDEDLGIMFTAKNKNKLTVDLFPKSSSSCEDCSKDTIDNSHSFDRLMSTASAPSSPSERVHLSRSWNSLAPTGTVSHSQVRKSDEFDTRDSSNGKHSKDTSSAKNKTKRKPIIFTLFPRSSGEIKNKECTQAEEAQEEAPAHALFLKETFDPKKEDIPQKRKMVTRVRSRSVGSEDDVIEEEDEASGSDSPNDDALQLPMTFNAENEKRKKKKNLAKDMKERLRFLRRRHTDGCLKDAEKLKSHLKSTTHAQALKWSESFDNLLADKYGLASFRSFLKTEFSDENIEFWLACEEYKKLRPSKWSSRAQKIYNDYVAIQAPREVNLDSHSRMATISNLSNPNKHAFDLAQKRIQSLMEKDSYPRFIRSEFYQSLINDKQKVSSC